jgi:ABC-type oligopeptide transport system substrate-binding subunit
MTYTFTLKNTYKFNTGQPVNAAAFVEALNRDADPAMQSPATIYMHEIVGADAVINGKAKTISGVKALGAYKLQIKLTTALPDLVARLTMPFFSPLPPGTAHDPKGLNTPPSAGPYYVQSRDINRQIVLARNPNYKGPRPHNVDQIVFTIGPSLEACRLNVEQDANDWCVDGIPPTAYQEVATKYGVNKPNGQFYFNPVLGTSYFALNTTRPVFQGNDGLLLRKAINYAIDRPALVRAAGYLGGIRTNHLLPAAMSPNKKLTATVPWPLKGSDPTAADKVMTAAKNTPDSITLYTATTGVRPIRAQVFQYDLKQIGINVNIQPYARAVQHQKCGTNGEPFDVCDEGWLTDYAEPVSFINPLLNGANIQQTNNNNEAYLNDPKVNAAIDKAAAMPFGPARALAFQTIDVNVMKNTVPYAPFATFVWRDFLSKSVGCYQYQVISAQVNLAAVCKK